MSLLRTLTVFLLLAHRAGAWQSPGYFSVPGPDAPELARRGEYSVGVRTLDVIHPGQVDILKFDKTTGKAPLSDRSLKLEVWYPATIPAGQEERTVYRSPMAGRDNPPGTLEVPGKALRDAPPVTGNRFPLVVVSHGYPGSRTFLSYLTENLASKGYVVVAIDHTDSVFGEVRGFASTLLNRSADQLFTIQAIAGLARQPGHFLRGLVDTEQVALIGYSMGGYGALASAGAGYNKASEPLKAQVPGGYMDPWYAGSPEFAAQPRSAIRAVVAIAPWGEQPPFEVWDAQGLAALRIPSLFIVGDHDDVAVYDQGVKRAYDRAVNSDRCLLVYENARHNTGGNPPPPGLTSFKDLQFFDEPVWSKLRLAAINQHFVTAFLDINLKGRTSEREYLNGPEAASKGFPQRWSLGLRIGCVAPAGK